MKKQPQSTPHISTQSKHQKYLRQSQLDFQKNYPKNIFIPMIQYLAQIGLQQQYQNQVGSRQQFQGKNVVSLSLIHKLMNSQWFRQNVQKQVLVSNISNKMFMNSKIKKKLFHIYVVRDLFEVYDEDLKQFKKRISKQANMISLMIYQQDQLFKFPSSILYLLRLFFKLIAEDQLQKNINKPTIENSMIVQSNENKDKEKEKDKKEIYQISPSKLSQLRKEESINQQFQQQYHQYQQQQNTPSQTSEQPEQQAHVSNLSLSRLKMKQGSKQEYKFYIRRIIHHFNSESLNKNFIQKQKYVQDQILNRENQLIKKYDLPIHVPSWSVFVNKVVERCFESYKRSAKITHAMMNEWINNFKQLITSVKGFAELNGREFKVNVNVKNIQCNKDNSQWNKREYINGLKNIKKQVPYRFSPLILQYFRE